MGSSPLLTVLLASTAIGLAHLSEDEQSGYRSKRGAPSYVLPRWPLRVPYAISSQFNTDQIATIKKAVGSIVAKTCINFVEVSDDKPKMLYMLTGGNYCGSPVGDTRFQFGPGGERNQNVTLSAGCAANIGNIQHETAHALGIGHTQSRSDRDNYVRVDSTNILSGNEGNFRKMEPEDSPNYGIPFEYGSRMMYTPYMMARNPTPVITPLEDGYLSAMGTAPELTFYDWKIINTHYNCTGKFSTTCSGDNTCQNGGYQHPRDCNRCICGDFFDGPKCEIEKGAITLTESEENVQFFNKTGVIALTTLGEKDWANYNVELRVIKAPNNSRIRIKIAEQHTQTVIEGHLLAHLTRCPERSCEVSGIEIADGDMLLSGKKFCCSEKEATSFVSKSNVVGYRAFVHKGTTFRSKVTFKIEPGTAPVTLTVPTTTTSLPTVPTTTTVPFTTTTPKIVTTTTTVPTTTTNPPTLPPTTTATTTPKPITNDFVCEY